MLAEDNDVQFEEDLIKNDFHIRSRKILGDPVTPGIISFLISKQIAKTERQATITIIIGIIIFLSISIWIVSNAIDTSGELIVIDRFGREISFDTYVEMLSRGEDPLNI